MKKSEFIDILKYLVPTAEYSRYGQNLEEDAENILNLFIESGFRLPQKQNTIVMDSNGQTKHSPVEYGWDNE